MELKPLVSMSKAEKMEHLRVCSKMFAYLRFKAANPGCDEEDAHAYAERHWQEHKDTALDYLAVKLAMAEKEAAPFN